MAERAASAQGPGVTVLICDDMPGYRSLLQLVIGEHEGLTVVGEAADGNEAIAQAELLQPDVILLDLSMPHRTGLEALPDLNRVAPGAQVIVLSGFVASIVQDDLAGKVAAYVQKGSHPDMILAAIETAAALRATEAP